MTDRVKGLTVILDKSYRDDDVQTIVNAIRMTKGVVRVEMVVEDSSAYVAEMSKASEIRSKLYDFINEHL